MEGGISGTWRDTKLWIELSRREDVLSESLRSIVIGVMPDIERVLSGGNSQPGDFTLHEASHSHRVAERMADLAGLSVLGALSSHDLVMLLLSAYLHDIGMTPRLARIHGHLAFLLSGDDAELSDGEGEDFQAWLDDEWDGLVPPLSAEVPTSTELRLARQIIAGYVRYRHNDWSQDWIREELGAVKEPFSGWLEDLILLCRSHHFDIDQLRASTFTPRLVGAPATVLHLRYCACLLRVADVLDFDPERTPPILYRHRDVSETSAIFWHKDQDLSFKVEDGHLVLHARPTDAVVHHAVEKTVEEVNSELLLARRLADETDFRHLSGQEDPLPHHWTLDTTVRAVIEPRDNAYEFIDGTFRPNPQRLLSLVGGVELYGSRLAAVREILQNAFDAVREQIARERLLSPEPGDESTLERIAAVHRVSLKLEKDGEGGYRLMCSDTGTGMSSDVIRSRFLIGGIAANHEIRALERTCNEHGFSVGRTARFGIGVLSYFILGSHLTVRTRRSLEAGDADGTGWTFTSNGLEDFGELKPEPGAHAGTQVTLQLRDDAFDPVGPDLDELLGLDSSGFAEKVRDYVARTIRRTPCAFEFEAPGFDCEPFSNEPGWVDRTDERNELLVGPMKRDTVTHRPEPDELLPTQRRKFLDQRSKRAMEQRDVAEKSLRVKVHERLLPDGLGSVRFAIGNFDLIWGSSFAFLDLSPDSDGSCVLKSLQGGTAGLSGGQLSMSWNGMSVDTERTDQLPRKVGNTTSAYVEVDWTSDAAGQLAVHRNTFRPSDRARRAVSWLFQEIADIRSEMIAAEADSPLAFVNSRLLERRPDPAMPRVWPTVAGIDKEVMKALTFPVVDLPRLEEVDLSRLEWRGSRLCPVVQVSTRSTRGYGRPHSWHGDEFFPTALAVCDIQGRLRPVPIWEEPLSSLSGDGLPRPSVDFPQEWRSLAVIRGQHRYTPGFSQLWNANHPLLQALDRDGWEWNEVTFRSSHNPLPFRDELLATPGRAAAWILRCIDSGDTELWEAVNDRSPELLADVWNLVPGLDELDQVVSWMDDAETEMLFALSPSWWQGFLDRDAELEFTARFPAPSEEWWITGPGGEREFRLA